MARPPSGDCRYLLGGLILLLVLFPAIEDMARPMLLTAFVAVVFLVGILAVHPGRSRVRNAGILAAGQIGLTSLAMSVNTASLAYIWMTVAVMAVTAALIGYCIYCVLCYVLQAQYITRDQIYAGIGVYLMLGFAFGCIYYLAGVLDPGSFALNATRQDVSHKVDLMYFSFVTLATLGYGDITPVTRAARIAAELEALSGSLYMAVFMARLVSLAGGPGPSVGADNRIPDRSPDSEAWIGSGGDSR